MKHGMSISAICTFLVVPFVSQAHLSEVSGSVAVVSDTAVIRYVPGAVVVASSKGRKTKIVADDGGDFCVRLPAGQYTLVQVTDAKGNRLRITTDQNTTFVVERGKPKRFDVMIEAPRAMSCARLLVPPVAGGCRLAALRPVRSRIR
jgi:hypothetical protein